jgi:hypothetical protein
VKAALTIQDEYEPDSIFIGAGKANPPAGVDTFSLIINEYGIRPELEPVSMDTKGAFYVWRDTSFVYHLVAHYKGLDTYGYDFEGVFIAEGGIDTISTTMDPLDEVTLSPDPRVATEIFS